MKGVKHRSAAPARAEWARAQSTLGRGKKKGASPQGPSAQPGGKPSSRAAHGFSPTARGERGGSGVVKQVIQDGRKGPAGDTM